MHLWCLLAKADLPWAQIIRWALVLSMYAAYKMFKPPGEQRAKSRRTAPRPTPAPQGNAKPRASPGRPAASPKTDPLLAEIQKFLKQPDPQKRSQQPSVSKPVVVGATKLRGTVVGDTIGRPLDSRHLDTADVGAGAAHMTDDLKRADAEREQHFQETFSHKLGRLTDTSVAGDKAIAPDAPTASTVPPVAIPLSDWLPLPTTKPEELRRALMLNEILQRPEHRW